MSRHSSPDHMISATDLSPIHGIKPEDELWLKNLARDANVEDLTLHMSGKSKVESEPILSFDPKSSSWWTGRYVGELRYQGRTLHIEPRFGMPALYRWLSRIWGIRLLTSEGHYERYRIWLWEVLARLWAGRLLAAAKHGLPCVRLAETYLGKTLRGRLHVPLTAQELSCGRQNLVSRTRNRCLDPRIGGIALEAFYRLQREISNLGDKRVWLSERGADIVNRLQARISRRDARTACMTRTPIRYSPITETYRPLVKLSLAVIQQKPLSATLAGKQKVLGVLLDMAEIWELYVYHLLRAHLLEVEVLHVGREISEQGRLLISKSSKETLGRLKPDILIRSHRDGRCIAVLDAKYKSTIPTIERTQGVLHQDLYQITAYLAAFAKPGLPFDGALVYPVSDDDRAKIMQLESANPWHFPGSPEKHLHFLGISVDDKESTELGSTQSELQFIKSTRELTHAQTHNVE